MRKIRPLLKIFGYSGRIPLNALRLRLLPACLLAAFSGTAAAGFQLWEQNASGIGTAYAGSAAIADNASTIFFNPAGMTQLSGVRVSLGVSAVGPSFEFNDRGSSGTGLVTGLSGGDGGDAGGWSAVPNAYLSWQLSPQWFVGFGISAPFGLATDYDDGWIGRYHSLKADIRTVNFNPSVAYKVNDKISLGFGVNYQLIDAKMTSLTHVGIPVTSELKGDDSAWGWNAGALFTLSPSMRVGVSYRSAMRYTIDGEQSVATTVFPAKTKVELPDTFILSVWQQVSDRWEAMGDLSYTDWSDFDKADIVTKSTGTLLGSEPFNYRDAWRIAWGAAYKANEAWKIKFGIAFDHTPTSDSHRTARVPDNDRLWLTLGAQWKPSKESAVDVGYAYLYLRDPSINQTKVLPAGTATLRGRYDDSGHVLGIQYSHGF
jgi:long-chain fatty acid transport protein